MFFTDASLDGFWQTAALSLRAVVDHQRCFSSFFPGLAVNNCPREDTYGITRFIPYFDSVSNPANPDCGDDWVVIDPDDLFDLIEEEDDDE